MRVIFHSEADQELTEATDWYEERSVLAAQAFEIEDAVPGFTASREGDGFTRRHGGAEAPLSPRLRVNTFPFPIHAF
jgi:hypothetical protein